MIPTNLITGFLGVGKTTAVLDLLKRKDAKENWAVLVNEYGEVAIDDAIIEGESGVAVRSMAGGCFCCTTAPLLPVALHFLLQEVKPDRLLIETSGLGHPARIVDMIRLNYKDRLELKATLGIVAPIDFLAPGMIDSNPVFRDQIQMSDVLILNKADTAKPDTIAAFQKWANELYPPKLLIAATTQGQLDPAWLDLTGEHERVPLYPNAHDDHLAPPDELQTLGKPQPGKPVRYLSSTTLCGWVFSPDDTFDEEKLVAFLGGLRECPRFKGVFHCEGSWISVNRSHGEPPVIKPTAYRRDSRVEFFGELDVDWLRIEEGLLECLDLPRGEAERDV